MNKILCTFCFVSCVCSSHRFNAMVNSFSEDILKDRVSFVCDLQWIQNKFSGISSFCSELLDQFNFQLSNSLVIDNMIKYYSYINSTETYTIKYVFDGVKITKDDEQKILNFVNNVISNKERINMDRMCNEMMSISDDKKFRNRVIDYYNSQILSDYVKKHNTLFTKALYFIESFKYSFSSAMKSYLKRKIKKGTFSKIEVHNKEYTIPLAILPMNFICRNFLNDTNTTYCVNNYASNNVQQLQNGKKMSKRKPQEVILNDIINGLERKNGELSRVVAKEKEQNRMIKKEKKLEYDRLMNENQLLKNNIKDLKSENVKLQDNLTKANEVIRNHQNAPKKIYPVRDFNFDTQTSEIFDIEKKDNFAIYTLKGVDNPMFKVYIDRNGRIIPAYKSLDKRVRSELHEIEYDNLVEFYNSATDDELIKEVYGEYEYLIGNGWVNDCGKYLNRAVGIANENKKMISYSTLSLCSTMQDSFEKLFQYLSNYLGTLAIDSLRYNDLVVCCYFSVIGGGLRNWFDNNSCTLVDRITSDMNLYVSTYKKCSNEFLQNNSALLGLTNTLSSQEEVPDQGDIN